MSTNPVAIAKKNEGNAAFKARNFALAITKYGEAIAADPNDHTFWSNRSACHAELGNWEAAAEDARQCTVVERTFVKGYFRLALALQNLQNFDAALDAVKKGLQQDPSNADLKRKRSEIEDSIRQGQVQGYIEQAQKLIREGNLADAIKAIDNGLRLDPGNTTLSSLESRARPQFEQQEKVRKSRLSPVERLKEQGDEEYKNAQFEIAIGTYTRALNQIGDMSTELALKCLANRAACYKQISNFDGVVADCSIVLEHRPNDVKALLRRAQALEAVEKYRLALQDTRTVLAMPVAEIGQQNYTLANGLQHRLNRVVQQMRSG